MNSFFKRFAEKPIFILLAINILVGLFAFRDYGFSWDEPLFYDYGNALGYAYSPREWFSGHFDLSKSYGASGDDHKTRGPAYLLLAREPVYLLEAFGLDQASAWHLVNFIFFQLGIYFLYRLALRWMNSSAALAAAALFSWQPMLWGHAFINPKDPPFLVFFLASVCLGFEMVDSLVENAESGMQNTGSRKQKYYTVIFPAAVLGIATSIRVLGPLAGLFVFIYFLARIQGVSAGSPTSPGFGSSPTSGAIGLQKQNLRVSVSPWFLFSAYAIIAIVVMFITWPFLWENPVSNFVGVLSFMSDNPTNLSVLFGGEVYRAGELPRQYLPFMLVTTLTEPVWLLFVFGVVVGYRKLFRQIAGNGTKRHDEASHPPAGRLPRPFQGLAMTRYDNVASLTLVLLWFIVLVAYALLRKPAMYDGMRHFLFILPPIFLFTGFAFEFNINQISSSWLRAGLMLALLSPGIVGIIQLHPYEYTYYNSFAGGTGRAFRQYETDYWLTCYRDAVKGLGKTADVPIDLYVHREAYIAAYYAEEKVNVHDLRGALKDIKPGDYVLVNTRTNEDRKVFKDAPTLLQIGREDAIFCVVKQIP